MQYTVIFMRCCADRFIDRSNYEQQTGSNYECIPISQDTEGNNSFITFIENWQSLLKGITNIANILNISNISDISDISDISEISISRSMLINDLQQSHGLQFQRDALIFWSLFYNVPSISVKQEGLCSLSNSKLSISNLLRILDFYKLWKYRLGIRCLTSRSNPKYSLNAF